MNGVIAWVGDATIGAGSLEWTRGQAESWDGRTILVPAGEFDASTPIGDISGFAGNTDDEITVPTPAWTAGATDGGGRVVVFLSVDADPITGSVAGWALLANSDLGAVASAIAIRTAAAVNSTAISSVTYDIIADTSSSIGIIVREPTTGPSALQMQAYQGMERMNGGFRR